MEDLLKALDEAVEKKYQRIKETGKIYSGIMEFYEQARWINPQIAEYGKIRKNPPNVLITNPEMLHLAIYNGDLK